MSKEIKLILMADSAFLMGGSQESPAYDAVTALDKKGFPFLPATAIKGALRMEFEAFSRGVEHAKVLPGIPGLETIGKINCNLDESIPEEDGAKEFCGCAKCLTCSLFGGGNKEGKLRFNAGVLAGSDQKILGDIIHEITPKGRREGVAISRTLGKAQEGSYYSTLTFPDLREIMPISFDASIDLYHPLNNDGELEFFKAFLGFIEKTGLIIGAGKSKGLGHFKIKWQLEEKKSEKKITGMVQHSETSKTVLKLFEVTLKTREPILIGGIKNRYLIDSLTYIPASTVGGSIGFNLDSRELDEKSRSIVFNLGPRKSRVSPFNFYMETAWPKPASTVKQKNVDKNDDSKNEDILIKDFIIKRAIEKEAFDRENIQDIFKEIFSGKTRSVGVCQSPQRTYVARVGIDRELQRARDGLLYAMNTIDADITFKGLLIAGEWIKEALENQDLFIGAKRTRGYGKTHVESLEELKQDTLLNFDENNNGVERKVKGLLKTTGMDLPNDTGRVFYTLDLLFDFFIPDKEAAKDKTGQKLVHEYFTGMYFKGIDMRIEKAYTRKTWRGGYDLKKKEQKPLREMVGAGSTLLVSVPAGQDQTFRKHISHMINNCINYDWDNAPLFWVNNPAHLTDGGKR